MKKFSFLFFCIITFSVAAAQLKNDSLLTDKESKWSVQVLGGPNYTFPGFYYPGENAKGLYNYDFSFLANRKVGTITTISFGISYCYLEYETWLTYYPADISKYTYSFYHLFSSIRLITNCRKINGSIDFGLAIDILSNNN